MLQKINYGSLKNRVPGALPATEIILIHFLEEGIIFFFFKNGSLQQIHQRLPPNKPGHNPSTVTQLLSGHDSYCEYLRR